MLFWCSHKCTLKLNDCDCTYHVCGILVLTIFMFRDDVYGMQGVGNLRALTWPLAIAVY